MLKYLAAISGVVLLASGLGGSAEAAALSPGGVRLQLAEQTANAVTKVGHYRRSYRSRRRRRSRYDDARNDYYLGGGIYFGRSGPAVNHGCRYNYSGYYVDHPCWARKALSPPRYR